LANFAVVSYMENQPINRSIDVPPQSLAAHAVQAIEGLGVATVRVFM
jgi:hypothetical protein